MGDPSQRASLDPYASHQSSASQPVEFGTEQFGTGTMGTLDTMSSMGTETMGSGTMSTMGGGNPEQASYRSRPSNIATGGPPAAASSFKPSPEYPPPRSPEREDPLDLADEVGWARSTDLWHLQSVPLRVITAHERVCSPVCQDAMCERWDILHTP